MIKQKLNSFVEHKASFCTISLHIYCIFIQNLTDNTKKRCFNTSYTYYMKPTLPALATFFVGG